jgi:hypothetical protein
MTEESDKPPTVNEQFIEGLLETAYRFDAEHDDQQIRALLARLDEPATKAAAPAIQPASIAPASATHRQWWSVAAIAASLLVAVSLAFGLLGTNPAYAMIEVALRPFKQPREYRIVVDHPNRPVFAKREATLYINTDERFVASIPALVPIGNSWLGGDEKECWLIPAVGPAVRGPKSILGNWLSQRSSDYPQMHFRTAIERMRSDYDLASYTEEVIRETVNDSPDDIRCQHVMGRLKGNSSIWPSTIDLWARSDSGVAQRVLLRWYDDANAEYRRIQFDLVSTSRLEDSWFDLDSHLPADKSIFNIASLSDLESL